MSPRRPHPLSSLDLLVFLCLCAAVGSSFAIAGGAPWWAWPLALSPLAPAALVASRFASVVRRNLRSAGGQCARCGYDLTGNVSGVCPECGRTR